jgi:hypothetical protein
MVVLISQMGKNVNSCNETTDYGMDNLNSVRVMAAGNIFPPWTSSSSSISLSRDRSIASSKVLERDCPGKVIMW